MQPIQRDTNRQSKLRELTDSLRDGIVAGRLPAGSRLPTRAELAEQFDVAPSTVQIGIEQLRRAGFIETRVPSGTFVAPHGPHRHRFALIEPYEPGDFGSGLFWQALATSARFRSAGRGPDQVVVAEAIDGHADREAYQMLLADLAQQRLAGLIFCHSPHRLIDTPLMTMPGVPRVAMMVGRNPHFRDLRVVQLDMQAFYRRAIELLVSRGRRRIAVIAGGVDSVEQIVPPDFEQVLREHGLDVPPYWRLAINPWRSGASRSITHLLFKGLGGQRPDGVIILDDHVINVALEGMAEAGARTPDDADVVGFTNFPVALPAPMPIHRLGASADDLLEAAIGLIRAARDLEPAPALKTVAPFFEHELSARAARQTALS